MAKHKSFSTAAQALYLTQPAVSTQIKLLEKAHEIRLFERYGGKIQLTIFGEILFSYTEKIFNLIKEAESIVEGVKGVNTGTLKIRASLTSGTYYLPDLLRIFKMNYPNIEIQMEVGNSEEAIESVLSFHSDLGFIAKRELSEKLVSIPFLNEELVIIVPPSHKFAKYKAVDLHKLDGEPFILREQGSGTREMVSEKFRQKNVSVKLVMQLGSSEAIKRAVEAGLGISIVPLMTVRRELNAGLLKGIRLTGEKMIRTFYIIYHREKYLSNIIQSFLKLASEYSRQELWA